MYAIKYSFLYFYIFSYILLYFSKEKQQRILHRLKIKPPIIVLNYAKIPINIQFSKRRKIILSLLINNFKERQFVMLIALFDYQFREKATCAVCVLFFI